MSTDILPIYTTDINIKYYLPILGLTQDFLKNTDNNNVTPILAYGILPFEYS